MPGPEARTLKLRWLMMLGFAIVPWSTGLVLDARFGARLYAPVAYAAAFLACGVVAVGGLVSAAFVIETRCRNVWWPSEAPGRP